MSGGMAADPPLRSFSTEVKSKVRTKPNHDPTGIYSAVQISREDLVGGGGGTTPLALM